MSIADSAMTREVLRDISKRPVDISQLHVHVARGIVYLQGRIDKVRGYHDDADLNEELNIILKLLKEKPGIRDVCCEVEFEGPGIIERMTPQKRRGYS